MTADFMIKILADWLDAPCNYGLNGISFDEFMFDHYGEEWCNDNCPIATDDYTKCWRKLFEALEREGYCK